MNEDNTPDPEFVNRLEWNLASAMRRQGAFNAASGTTRRFRFRLGTTLALAVASMCIGGVGTYAATRGVDSQTAALYVARGEALLEIARTRLQHFAERLAKTQTLVKQGAAPESQLRADEFHYVHAQCETEIRELELAETRLTGQEPNDALSAPLVAGRDFVTERLAARHRQMEMPLALKVEQLRRMERLADAGAVHASELKAAQMAVIGAEREVAGVERRIELRASFLADELSATDVELQDMLIAATAAREAAERHREIASEQYARLADLSGRGLVSSSELRAAEANVLTVQAQVDLAELEVRILNQKTAEAGEE